MKKSRKVIISVLITVFCLSLFSLKDSVFASKYTCSDIFRLRNEMTILNSNEIPTSLKTYDNNTVAREFDKGYKGTVFSSSTVGSSVDLINGFIGNFETTFRVFSEVNYHDESGTDWNSTTFKNDYLDLSELSIVFTDSNQKSFTVAIKGGEAWNTVTPSARVIVGKTETGFHYQTDQTEPSNTVSKNSAGYYTRIGGTTFCNVAFTGKELTSENSKPITIGFNPQTMEVYTYHYGSYITVEKQKRIIAVLDDEETLGLSSIDSFSDYKVSFQMTAITSGKTGRFILYDINGQQLDSADLKANIGPTTYVTNNQNGVAGMKFYIPQAVKCDVFNGVNNFDGRISCIKESTLESITVYNADGNPTETYSQGCYFIPENAGVYDLSYIANGSGISGKEFVLPISVLSKKPNTRFNVEGNYSLIENSSVGAGQKIPLYKCIFSSSLYNDNADKTSYITVKKDGQTLMRRLADELAYYSVDEGEYQIIYSSDYDGIDNLTISFTVDKSKPYFDIAGSYPYYVERTSSFVPYKATAVYGTTSAKTSVYVIDPQGNIVSSGKAVELSLLGEYEIRYVTDLGGKNSYSQFVKVAESAGSLFSKNSNVTVEFGDTGKLYQRTVSGVVITSDAEGASVTYSKIINLKNSTKNDPLIEIIALPQTVGVHDMYQFTVTLTDIYDSKNTVEIIAYKSNWGNVWSYIKAGAKNQIPGGWEKDTVLTAVHTGCPVYFSFTGESRIGAESLIYYYDNQEKALYVSNVEHPGYLCGNQVIDFDDSQCFAEKTLWNGFTTGEVYLSVSMELLQSSTSSLLIKSIYGQEFVDEWINDIQSPEIEIDYGKYNENELPYGIVNTSYSVFDGFAFDDFDGKTDVTVSAYYAYRKVGEVKLPINNNCFTPTKEGVVTLVYQAKDKSGNVSEKTVKINVYGNALKEFTFVWDKDLPTTLEMGKSISLPSGKAVGGSGELDVTYKVYDNSGAQVELTNDEFLLTVAGDYKVQVIISDYLQRSKVFEYTVECFISDNPIFEEVSFPKAFVSGTEYELSKTSAIDYKANNGVPTYCDVKYFLLQNGVETEINRTKFIPTIESDCEDAQIILRAIGKNGNTELRFDVQIVKNKDSAGNYTIQNTFGRRGISEVVATSKSVSFSTDTSFSEINFANSLIASAFSLNFKIDETKNNFDSVTVRLADSVNLNKYVDIVIEKNADKNATTSTLVLGGKRYEISSTFYGNTSYGFKLNYSANSLAIMDGNLSKQIAVIGTFADNTPFTGFESGKLYFSLIFGNVTGESAIIIEQILNQPINNTTKDRIMPVIVIDGEIKFSSFKDQVYTVPKGFAGDVLDSDVELNVRIVSPSGNVVYNGDIQRDYEFSPNEFGKYVIVYSAVDSKNNRNYLTYEIYIKDREKPTITVINVPQSVKVNQTVTLPSANVSDNNDGNLTYRIFVTSPSGKMVEITDRKYTFNVKGNYVVTYYAEDSYGNYCSKKFIIGVK